jgi:hypothetical protein
MTTPTTQYPDRDMRLLKRDYSLYVRDLDTLHRLKRLHGWWTAAEAISYLLRAYGEPELAERDPTGWTIANPLDDRSGELPRRFLRRAR